MRASRLLQILLILQNRGRQTAGQLAGELEVAPRTILRDVDAMTEAGLPVRVLRGKLGGIELGFNYRTRLTGLDQDEARALGLMLSVDNPFISLLHLDSAARRARTKLIESLPDTTRSHVKAIQPQFTVKTDPLDVDQRVQAMAVAVQRRVVVRIRFSADAEQTVHPTALQTTAETWQVFDSQSSEWIALEDWGRVNVSRQPIPNA